MHKRCKRQENKVNENAVDERQSNKREQTFSKKLS